MLFVNFKIRTIITEEIVCHSTSYFVKSIQTWDNKLCCLIILTDIVILGFAMELVSLKNLTHFNIK